MLETQLKLQSDSGLKAIPDASSPYYIHPSDNCSTQLVSVPFKGEGYADWKRSMMIAMSVKNKLGFVTGTIPKPHSDSLDFEAWNRCNDLLIAWLLHNLDPIIARSVLYFNTANEIWTDLEERYGYVSGAQLFSLEQKLSEITQGSLNIAEFFTEIKGIWDKISTANPLPLCTCNKCTCNLTQKIFKMQQEQRLLQFLMKLNNHFSAARGNLLMMQPLPTLSQAYRLLAQDEKQREISHEQSHTMDNMVFAFDNKRQHEYYLNRGDISQQSSNFGKNTSSQHGNNTHFQHTSGGQFRSKSFTDRAADSSW